MYEMFKSNPEIQKIIGSKQFPYSEKNHGTKNKA